MDAVQRSLLLAHCRLDPTEMTDAEIILLEMYYDAAVDYMRDAGVEKPADLGRLSKYNLVVFPMTLNAWDHRDLSEIAATAENPVVRRYINQLKQSEPVPAE